MDAKICKKGEFFSSSAKRCINFKKFEEEWSWNQKNLKILQDIASNYFGGVGISPDHDDMTNFMTEWIANVNGVESCEIDEKRMWKTMKGVIIK